MKMRKLLIFILLGFIIASCNKDDNNIAQGNFGKNKFRVKEIKGSNAHWGDYTMIVSYRAEEMENIWVRHGQDTIAHLTKEEKPVGNGNDYASTIYRINDYVANISEDSIRKLEDKYGVEAAKDSIPVVEREVFSAQVYYDNGRLWQQILLTSVPYPDMSEGAQYLKKERYKYIYEYDANGNIGICRMFIDTFDTSDPDLNADVQERAVRKLVFDYSGDRIAGMEEYRAEDEYGSDASYVKVPDWNFIYAGDRLTAANDLTYQWSGNTLSVTRDGKVVRYTLNNDGYPTRIDYANGEYVEVTYEAGNGNFGIFSPLLDQNFQIPYVR